MARQGQKLVHLHTSGTTDTNSVLLVNNGNYELELGEIAVQHNSGDAKLYIRLSDPTTGEKVSSLGEFITKSAIESMLTSATETIDTTIDGLDGRVEALENKVGDGFGTGTTLTQAISSATAATQDVADDLANEITARTDGDQAIMNLIGDGFDSTDTIAKAIADEIERAGDAEQALETSIGNVSSDLATETSARTDADAAIQEQIGTGFTSNFTIADAIAALGGAGGTAETRIIAIEEALPISGFSSANTVSEAISAVDADVTTLEGIVSGYTGTGAIKTDVDSVRTTANSALQSISAGTVNDYVTVTVGAPSDNNQTVAVAVAAQDIDTATALKQGFADAYDVKTVVGSATTRITALESDNTKLMNRTSGFSDTAGSIKDYIDDKVANEIASVYKVKGSVTQFNDLPASGNVEGDVWNVVSSATVDQKVYPAGTNFVWVAEDTSATPTVAAHWDALGGTVDLSPYMLAADFNTWTSSTYAAKIQEIETSVTNEGTARQNGDTAIQNQIGNGFSSANTIADAITNISTGLTAEQTARGNADTALQNQIGTGFDSEHTIAAAIASLSGESGTAETRIQAAETAIDALEDALPSTVYNSTSTVQMAITAATQATQTVADNLATEITDRTNADTAIQNQIGNGFDSANTITAAISGINDEIGTGFTSSNTIASAVGQNTSDITELQGLLPKSAFTSTNTVEKALTAATQATQTVADDLANEITARTAGDGAIQEQIGNGFDSANTIADAISDINNLIGTGFTVDNITTQVKQNATDITTINDKLGTGFTSSATVRDAIDALSGATTAIQAITVDNSNTNGITATPNANTHEVALNFDNMVIDCGTY